MILWQDIKLPPINLLNIGTHMLKRDKDIANIEIEIANCNAALARLDSIIYSYNEEISEIITELEDEDTLGDPEHLDELEISLTGLMTDVSNYSEEESILEADLIKLISDLDSIQYDK